MSDDKINQCQGCQAGWEVVKSVYGDLLHRVEGGYKNEVVGCTKDRYLTTNRGIEDD